MGLVQKQKMTLYRCDTCKIRFEWLEDMAIGENGLLCSRCYEAEVKDRDALILIANNILSMRMELDRRSKRTHSLWMYQLQNS